MKIDKAKVKTFQNQGPKEITNLMKRELQIVSLAHEEIKRRGFDESYEQFGEMVYDLVYELHRALQPIKESC